VLAPLKASKHRADRLHRQLAAKHFGLQITSKWVGFTRLPGVADLGERCVPSANARGFASTSSASALGSSTASTPCSSPMGFRVPVSDLFGVHGRTLLAGDVVPEPWRGHLATAVALIDDLTRCITQLERELRRLGVGHRYVPLLMTAPGIAWVLGYTIAAEIGDVARFPTPLKFTSYTGLCPRIYQSGGRERRGELSNLGPRYLRWALLEAATHAGRHPAYRARYQRTKRRLGRQRGAKVAQIDIARKLAEPIWYMLTLTRQQPFAPAGATRALAA
jgi:transposase